MSKNLKANAISRRNFLKAGAIIGGGIAAGFPAIYAQDRPVSAAAAAASKAKLKSFGMAKSVIQIWLWGGPAHTDTWDPKPDSGYDYCGPLANPIKTNLDGLIIGQLMPNLTKCADKYAVIRSCTHGENAHETGSYLVQTGRMPGRYVYPCAGAVVSKFKGYDGGYKGMIPPYIVLTQPQGRFSEAGFLGTKYKPFATGSDPSRIPFEVEGIVARGISERRQKARKELLDDLNTFKKAMSKSGYLSASDSAVDQAYNLVLGDAGKVFNISTEDEKTRAEYGNNWIGNSCLIARKLVEAGVPYVTINYNGWDTHKGHFGEMNKRLPQTDKAIAALINDLSQRGLLDSTIIWWSGEFGRTPRISWEPPYSGGRQHWGHAFASMLAGGGFKGGSVVGKTDDKGEYVEERSVYPGDLIGSIYYNLGIDPDATLTTPQGDIVRLIPESSEDVKTGGLLTEIMRA